MRCTRQAENLPALGVLFFGVFFFISDPCLALSPSSLSQIHCQVLKVGTD